MDLKLVDCTLGILILLILEKVLVPIQKKTELVSEINNTQYQCPLTLEQFCNTLSPEYIKKFDNYNYIVNSNVISEEFHALYKLYQLLKSNDENMLYSGVKCISEAGEQNLLDCI